MSDADKALEIIQDAFKIRGMYDEAKEQLRLCAERVKELEEALRDIANMDAFNITESFRVVQGIAKKALGGAE